MHFISCNCDKSMKIQFIFFIMVLITLPHIAYAESELIPPWVKNTAGWWANNEISENEFVNAIEFLINVGIIAINENTETKLSDYLLTWDEIVLDANYGFIGSITLKNYFIGESPLIINGNPDINSYTDVASYDLLNSGVAMYQLTGGDMYLEQARRTADFIETHSLTDKSLVILWNPHTGTIHERCCTTNQEILSDVSNLALLDSSYKELVKKLANEIIEYEINSQTQLFYSGIDNDGNLGPDVNMNLSYRGSSGLESLLLAYEVTSDVTYLEQVKETILAYWDLRNKETNLIPSMINSDTNEIEQHFMQQYGAGIFLKILLHHYYLTDDPEILSIMKTYSDSVIEYFWDGKTWEYRVNDDGTVMSPSIDANFGKLDDALFLLYDLDPIMFKESYHFAKSNYSNSLQNDLIISNNLVIHSVKDDGSRDRPQSMMNYAFLINQNIASRLYQDTSEVEYLSDMHKFYDGVITNHKREFGYIHGIDAYSNEDANLGLQLNQRSPANIANKINLTFIPSSDVTIIWTVIGNHELSQPFITTFHDTGRFNNVEFDYKTRSIDLKTVYGNGTITFADEIESVMVDGVLYDDFTDYTLNTVDGKHRYQIFLQP